MLLDSSDPRPIHFVGIAGAGMSALAELFVRRGVTVTGCDINPQDVDDLRKLGIKIVQGHDPSHVAGARAVVVTSAVAKGHPELEQARSSGIPVIRRAEALGDATSGDGRELVVIHIERGRTVGDFALDGASGRHPDDAGGIDLSQTSPPEGRELRGTPVDFGLPPASVQDDGRSDLARAVVRNQRESLVTELGPDSEY